MVKVFNCFKLWNIFAEDSILDVWFVPTHTLITTTIFLCFYLYWFLGLKPQTLFVTLEKKYLRKKKDLKSASKSGNSADVMLKADKAFDSYKFLSWQGVTYADSAPSLNRFFEPVSQK